jgi:hypothetical protein
MGIFKFEALDLGEDFEDINTLFASFLLGFAGVFFVLMPHHNTAIHPKPELARVKDLWALEARTQEQNNLLINLAISVVATSGIGGFFLDQSRLQLESLRKRSPRNINEL